MNYKSKRVSAGIGTYTMAKELGVDEEKYKNLERGKLELKGQLLEKFMQTIGKAKEIKFNRMDKMHEINEWVNSGQAAIDVKNTGYSQVEIGNLINASNSAICHLLKDKRGSDDLKEKLYDFVTNPLNKKVEDKKDRKEIKYKTYTLTNNNFIKLKLSNKISKDHTLYKIKEILDNNDITRKELVELSEHSYSNLTRLIGEKYIEESKETRELLYQNLLKKYGTSESEPTEEIVEEKAIEQVIETPVEKTCECACENVHKNEYIDELKEQIFNLKKENIYLKESIKRLFNI